MHNLEQQMKEAVGQATLAPSGHNSQPWRFGLNVDEATVDLWADHARRLPVIDPQDRELTISCGAALLNLRLALAQLGLPHRVELLPGQPGSLAGASSDSPFRPPGGGETGQLARVYVEPWLEANAADADRAKAIPLRRTYRFPFLPRPVDLAVVEELEAAARLEGARACWVQEPDERRELAALIREADVSMATDAHFRQELSAWMRSHHTAREDGEITVFDDFGSALAPLLTRFLNWGPQAAAHDEKLALEAPLLLVLTTPGDTPSDWLRAGQALQRLLLAGARHEVQASYLNQPLEVPELRGRVACEGVPQLVLRLGYQRHAPRPTPRRPLQEVLQA